MTTAIRISVEHTPRERGYIYYLDQQGYLARRPMATNPGGKRSRVGHEQIAMVEGCIYFLDRKGFISAVPARNYSGGFSEEQRLRQLKASRQDILRRYNTEERRQLAQPVNTNDGPRKHSAITYTPSAIPLRTDARIGNCSD